MAYLRPAVEKDLRRSLRDPLALLLWLGIPLLVGGLIILASGGRSGATPMAHVLIADEDDSFLSGFLIRSLAQAGDAGPPVRGETVEREAGLERMEEGEATALLVIPEGFGQALIDEKPSRLLLVTNPSQRILPGIVEEGLEILTEGTFYAHRVFGSEIREIVGSAGGGGDVTSAQVASISVRINEMVQRLEEYLFPPAIELTTRADDESAGEKISVAVLFLPGILLMALIFMASGLSEDIWRERDLGTLRRAVSVPGGVVELLAGKVIAGGVLIVGSTLVVLIAGMAYVDLPLSRLPLALVWSSFSGTVFLVGMLLIQLHATSQRAGSVLTMSIVFPLLMLGGSFFPTEAMPGWMAAIGRMTPNGWALEQLKDILLARQEPTSLAAAFAILLGVGAGLFLLAARRLGRTFARS